MSLDDSELIERCRAGDLSAFEPLVEKYRQRVWRLAYQILRDREEAWDVAQEAFVRAYQALPRFRQAAAFSTWLYRITTNAALDLVRRRPAIPPVELTADHPARDDPEAEAQRREIHRRVHAALGHLPPEYRAAVVLRDLQGLEYVEVARILQVPIGTVRSRLSRGREALRAQLTDLVAAEG